MWSGRLPSTCPNSDTLTRTSSTRTGISHLGCPNDPEGPTVLMNSDAPILLEAIKHHQQQYPEVFAHGSRKDCQGTRTARSRSARSPTRKNSSKHVAEEDLDLTYRNEAALTVVAHGPPGRGKPDRTAARQARPQEERGVATPAPKPQAPPHRRAGLSAIVGDPMPAGSWLLPDILRGLTRC